MMAAIPGALLPIPLALATIVLLIAGITSTDAIPVYISVLVAYLVTYGLGMLGRGQANRA
jgi:hypothetical protein